MKIISKYKDYYDYLQGIYGVDPILILDRTQFLIPALRHYDVINIIIGDVLFQGIMINGTVLYGEDLIPFAEKEDRGKNRYLRFFHDTRKHYVINTSNHQFSRNNTYTDVLKNPVTVTSDVVKSILKIKEIPDYPIFSVVNREIYPYPLLKDLNFATVLTPEEVWFKLSDWLGREKIIEDKRTNLDKILSKGFDKVTSFRNIK